MAAAFPTGQGLTAAQWESWFTAFAAANPTVPKTYTGTNAAAKGKTWAGVYAAELASAPSDSPDTVAEATIVLIEDQALANGVDATAQQAWTMPEIAGTSATAGVDQALGTFAQPLDFLAGIANFFDDLSQSNTWIRVAKIVVGAVLVIVGAAHLTGANKVVDQAAKVAPLLAA